MARIVGMIAVVACLTATVAYAMPSSLILVPSTDVQAERSFQINYDNVTILGTPNKVARDGSAFGLQYGVCKGLEVGLDYATKTDDPLYFNAKYSFDSFGANEEFGFAIGGVGFGTNENTSPNIWYGVASYKFGVDRLHVGFFTGDDNVLADPFDGSDESSGLMLGWDRPLDDKWWLGVDYVSGESAIGGLNVGVKYAVSDNSSIMLGYDFWNNDGLASSLNVQYDLMLGK